MKNIWKVIIAACLAALIAGGAALADEGVLTLPAELTAIEEEAFYGIAGARKVVVQEGATTIGARAFAESRFTEIRLPATVTDIGSGAFRNCGNPSEPARYFCLPAGVNVPADAFEGCRASVYLNGNEIPYFRYTVGDAGVTITGLIGYASIREAVIPAVIQGKPVIAIGENVFNGKRELAHVVIPATVTSIGPGAFRNCTALTQVDLPAGLTSLGSGAFWNTGLTSVVIPSGLTTIADNTFRETKLVDVTIPQNVTAIGNGAFQSVQTMTRVVMPEGLVTIGENAFNDCYTLAQADIPSTVTQIGYQAFRYCEALTHATIPAGVTELSNSAFVHCRGLESVQLPDTLTAIGNYAFEGCRKLTTINFPAGLVSLGQQSFQDTCVGQPGNPVFTLPETVTLGTGVFRGCGAALCVARGGALEAQLKSPGYTTTLTHPDRLDYRYQYKTVNNELTLYLTAYAGAGGNVVIPAGPAVIGENAFYENAAVTGVTIPAGVTLLDRGAFEKCSNLASVTMPDGVLTIGDRAFHSCGALTNVRFPADLQRIGSDAFDNACMAGGVHYYELPDNIQALGWAPFDNNFGAVLCFTRGSATATLFQQNQYIYTYKGETDFRYRWYGNEGTEGHQERLLQYLGNAASVEIPPYVWLIDDNAFRGNGTITSVVIPEGVTRINANAFRDCANLTDVTFPESLSSIWDNAFNGCGSAAQETFCFQLPENISDMARFVFEDCSAILVCGLETTTAGTISNRGYSFVRKDREQELDIRYKYAYFNNEWLWSLYDYVGEANSVRLPDDCARVGGDKLWTKVNNGLELVCGQMSDTAGGLSRAEVNFTFPGHEGLRYRIINNVLYIMGYTGTDNEIIIPAAQDYVDAGVDEQIRANAFQNQTAITKVVVPEGVTRINDGAFRNCYMLSDIRLPNSLKIFEQCVFVNCGRDAAKPFYFVLPDNMETMAGRGGGAQTFSDCNAILETGKYSQTAALLTDKNFCYTVAGEHDFRYRYIEYTEGEVTGRRLWLVGYAGEGGTVTIPQGIYGIRQYQWDSPYGSYEPDFFGRGDITSLVIPEGTVVIEDSAFRGCVNLVDITFPESLKVLKNHAFEQCGKNATTLHYYVLPDNMTEISTNVDAGWGAFTDINMGRIVSSPNCSTALQLSGIDTYSHGGSYRFALKGHETDGLLYRYRQYATQTQGEYENRLILEQYEGTDIQVTIPSGTGLYGIDNRVFQNRSNLQQVIIPSGVEWFGEEVFDGCAVLHQGSIENVIQLSDTLKRIGNRTFRDLGSGYTTRFYLLLPASLEEFDLNIFTGCNAVLVAPAGSYAASVLYANWYVYYNTLEDAIAQTNLQYQHYYVNGLEQPHVHYGNP